MPLSEIRDQFVDLSGRRDLALASPMADVEKRADWFINAGVRLLDVTQRTEWSVARYSYDLAIDGYKIVIPEPRTIQKVYAQNANGRIELKKKLFAEMRDLFKKAPANVASSKPKYYSRGVHMPAPNQLALKTSDYSGDFTYDFEETMFSDTTTPGDIGRYKSALLMVMAPVSELYTITVIGEFYSKVLAVATDDNYWSIQWPDLLIMASLRQLEAFYRNREGMADFEAGMLPITTGMEKDLVSQEAASTNVMGG